MIYTDANYYRRGALPQLLRCGIPITPLRGAVEAVLSRQIVILLGTPHKWSAAKVLLAAR
jgi:hypothetical protein